MKPPLRDAVVAPVLNRMLILEDPMDAADGAGGFTQNWTALGQLWGAVSLRSGRSFAGQSLAKFQVIVRAAPQGAPQRPVAGQRFREAARLFQITAVSEYDVAGRYLKCFANEEVIT